LDKQLLTDSGHDSSALKRYFQQSHHVVVVGVRWESWMGLLMPSVKEQESIRGASPNIGTNTRTTSMSQNVANSRTGVKTMGTYTNKAECTSLVVQTLAHINGGPRPTMPVGYSFPARQNGGRASVWPRAANKWARAWRKWELFLDNPTSPSWSIFGMEGNVKLEGGEKPFITFSGIPGIPCPGAGECLTFCYSFKSWRYPDAFFRQLQNLYLLKTDEGRRTIATAFEALPGDGRDLRLYVDGDFDSLSTLRFWFGLLDTRPEIPTYGYSKSWELLLLWDKLGQSFPTNYTLNASSGSKYGPDMQAQIAKLSCYRGTFDALPVTYKMPAKALEPRAWQAWAQALRATARGLGYGKVFVCPGKCGACIPDGHACGSAKFKNVPIVIGQH
jgi:hypothetical protein